MRRKKSKSETGSGTDDACRGRKWYGDRFTCLLLLMKAEIKQGGHHFIAYLLQLCVSPVQKAKPKKSYLPATQ